MRRNNIGISALLASAFLYATYGISSKIIGGSFAPFYQAWTRVGISLILFVAFGLIFKLFVKIQKEDFKWFAIMGLSGPLVVAPLFYAFVNLNLGTALLIHYAATVITSYALGALLYKERLTRLSFVALFLAMTGLWLVYKGDINITQLLPVLSAFISGVFFSVYFVISKKINFKYSPTQINAIAHALMLVLNLLISIMLKESVNTNFLSLSWAANIAYGIAGFIGAGLTIFGFKYIEANRGSLVLLSEIVFGLIFGFVFFSEVLSLTTIAGGVLIVFAIALPNIMNLLNQKSTNDNKF